MTTLKLGTRGSDLARTQSGHVAQALTEATGVEVELVIISTKGDQVRDKPLQEVGGKGLFTKAIEDAMLRGEVDFAVHSMKDMPTDEPPGLAIVACPERVDPRDVLVGSTLVDLAAGAVVGTGSVRRALQLRGLRPDLEIRGIRGNVETRIGKQRSGEYDAVVLAAAGMKRLGLDDQITETLPVAQCIPAVGQGALAIQCRKADKDTLSLMESVHHERTARCIAAERAFLHEVSGGCSAPAAAHCWWDGETLVVSGVWAADADGAGRVLTLRSDPLHAAPMGRELARRLKGGDGTPIQALAQG